MIDPIIVENVDKSFKVYKDKGRSLKEKILFWHRNKYDKRVVLENINFTVKKGEAIGLIGTNGSGKSTMLKLLSRIMYPNEGHIYIERRVASLIELGAGFHPDMTGRENIYINASIFGLTRKEIDIKLQSIIDFSELEQFIDEPVRIYSSGMYMRLAFSIAISVDADVLLIDEILAVGDIRFQEKCFNKLREIKDEGTTIVLVTHSMEQVKIFCDRALWLKNGSLFMNDKPEIVVDKYMSYMHDV